MIDKYSKGNALQIASVKENKLCINIDIFNSILNKVGNKKLSIISINGPMRGGKSYMLGHFLRYLSSTKEEDWFSKTLTNEFHWLNSAERQTTGIQMWSEPFFLRKNDEEIAVLLMDTQGCFDDQTTTHENSLIFSLSCLLSSTLIYNVSKQLTEDILQFLQMFVGFAKLTEDSDEPQSFSKLIFLIRDWQCPKEYNYGYYDESTTAGPNNFLSDNLDLKPDMIPEVRNTREEIISSFQNIGCCLMPYPGEELAINDKKESASALFIKTVKHFIPRVLDSKYIITKIIGGQQIDGFLLKRLVHDWSVYFADNEFLELKSLTDSTAEVQNLIAFNFAQKVYRSQMDKLIINSNGLSDEEFEYNHEKFLKETVESFQNTKKLKSSKINCKYLKMLEETIQMTFESFKQINITQRKFYKFKLKSEITRKKLKMDIEMKAQLAKDILQKLQIELNLQVLNAEELQLKLRKDLNKKVMNTKKGQLMLKINIENQKQLNCEREQKLMIEFQKHLINSKELQQNLRKNKEIHALESEERLQQLKVEMEKREIESQLKHLRLKLLIEKNERNSTEIQRQIKYNNKRQKREYLERYKTFKFELERKTKEDEELSLSLKNEIRENTIKLKETQNQLQQKLEKQHRELIGIPQHLRQTQLNIQSDINDSIIEERLQRLNREVNHLNDLKQRVREMEERT